jgi:type 1 glutamine amidotransferase
MNPVAAIAAAAMLMGSPDPAERLKPRVVRAGETAVLVFTRTTGFRHDSIPDAIAAVRRIGTENGFSVDATEDPSAFTDANLAPYRAVLFLLTTGEVLGDEEQAAFERWIRAGGGWVGVHSASDTEYEWPFYGELAGAYFAGHPEIQPATVHVEDRVHPSTSALPEAWPRTDEWYNFRANPRGSVHVLATVDEGTYSGGSMGADHPIAWCQEFAGGRAFYTAGGHTRESYAEPLFIAHLTGAIRWAAGLAPGYCGDAGRETPRRAAPRRPPPRVVTPRN